ncbi:MAG: SpoIIIAH-like family protein [Clostridia bacterium]|nr:SpoIIIAH-like family protein [Clostridia bacterium]
MKDRILNALMLLTVAAALTLTLFRADGAREETASALPPITAVTALPTARPIDAYRQHRETERQQEQAALLALAASEQTTPELRALSEEQLRQMTADSETELALEAVLIARGYEDALCVCRGSSVTVLSGRSLQEADAALIVALAQEIAAIPAENIRVSAY